MQIRIDKVFLYLKNITLEKEYSLQELYIINLQGVKESIIYN